MATEVRGKPPFMTTCWGLTETAPACVFQHEQSDMPGNLGVPLAEVTVKLVPEELPRYEVRVKGPNVLSGYFGDAEKTADAFDEDGYFATGDAMTLVDPNDAAQGLRFDGRISEDFKLATGIWVRAATMRLELLVALAPMAADVIVTGQGRDQVGLLIIPAPDFAATLDQDSGAYLPAGAPKLINVLRAQAEIATGSSNRITRAMILSEPPSMAAGEVTAKGNLNYSRLLSRRSDQVERLYSSGDPAVIQLSRNSD